MWQFLQFLNSWYFGEFRLTTWYIRKFPLCLILFFSSSDYGLPHNEVQSNFELSISDQNGPTTVTSPLLFSLLTGQSWTKWMLTNYCSNVDFSPFQIPIFPLFILRLVLWNSNSYIPETEKVQYLYGICWIYWWTTKGH